MAAPARPAHPDPLHRVLAAAWHLLCVTGRAIARAGVAVARWCRGAEQCGDDRDDKPLSRAERKRLRKQKVREALAVKKAA